MRTYYSKGGGLREWVKQNWVDIANKKSDGSYPKCGRSGGEKRKNYPKCVPIAKARGMSKGQRAGAVKRKQAYPSIEEQLDMQYHDSVNGTTTWNDAIAAVKSSIAKE